MENTETNAVETVVTQDTNFMSPEQRAIVETLDAQLQTLEFPTYTDLLALLKLAVQARGRCRLLDDKEIGMMCGALLAAKQAPN